MIKYLELKRPALLLLLRLDLHKLILKVVLLFLFSTSLLVAQESSSSDNRLQQTTSPYLQLHATDKIAWQPWSESLFKQAQELNKPLFISVGYSSCHWCHVMARESFADLEVARLINRYFIAIKVDREQLPDVDRYFQLTAEALGQSKGWPLNLLVDAEKIPFSASGYLPKDQFLTELEKGYQLWQRPDQINSMTHALRDKLSQRQRYTKRSEKLGLHALVVAEKQLMRNFDDLSGGFGSVSKFPLEQVLTFLLQHAIRQQDKTLLEKVTFTLDQMQQGAIYDQLGGGFHRYTVDPEWHEPHYEKMLYTQALMIELYTLAWQHTGDPLYQRTVEQTISFVKREMMAENGTFYSALDAESEGIDGHYYLWRFSQLEKLLSPVELTFTQKLFDLELHSSEATPLYLNNSLKELQQRSESSSKLFLERVEYIRRKLDQARGKRGKPWVDKKVITAWNALMIKALTKAASAFENTHYKQLAINAAQQLWQQQWYKGQLLRDSFNLKPGLPGQLQDYALLAQACLTLYDDNRQTIWLERSTALTTKLLHQFWPDSDNPIKLSDNQLPATEGVSFDHYLPSPINVTYDLFSALESRTGNTDYAELRDKLLANFIEQVLSKPELHPTLLRTYANYNISNTTSLSYAAKGAVRLHLTRDRNGYLLQMNIKPGWYVQSHEPTGKQIATQLKADWLRHIIYPTTKTKKMSFSEELLQVYAGNLKFHLPRQYAERAINKVLTITLQACSPQLCLPPEQVRLRALH